MGYEICKFLLIWLTIQLIFSAIAMLIFNRIETFQTFDITILYFIQASIGSWDLNVFTHFD